MVTGRSTPVENQASTRSTLGWRANSHSARGAGSSFRSRRSTRSTRRSSATARSSLISAQRAWAISSRLDERSNRARCGWDWSSISKWGVGSGAESVPRAVASVAPGIDCWRKSRSLPLAVLTRRCASERPPSLDVNEARLEEVILLIRQWRQSQLSSPIFHHKPELIFHPQIYIRRNTVHLISTFISRRVEPIDSDSGVRDVVYYIHGGFGVRAEAGKSASGHNVVPPALNASEQRQPLRNRVACVKRDAVEIVLERPVRLKRPVRVYYRNIHIAMVVIHGNGPAVEIKDAINE